MGRGDGNDPRDDVSAWVRTAPWRELLPERRIDAAGERAGAEVLAVLPLGRCCLAVARSDEELLVVPVAGDAPPRRARAGDGTFAAIARTMREDERANGFTATAFDAARIAAGEDEAAIEVDQSNDSVVVGGDTVVKLFPLTSSGAQPGLDLPVHLARVGFEAIPAPLGSLAWTSPAGDDVLLATATQFLPAARDGWAWYLERLLGWLDGERDDASAIEPAPELGSIAARMHVGLATPSAVLPDPVGTADGATVWRWRDRAVSTAREAMACTPGAEGRRLAGRADAILAELEAIGEAVGVATTRVHGDFHVGQILEWRGGYAVTDFDGNPVSPVEERTAFDTPVRDVAAFVCSIDHVGRVASTRRHGHEAAIEAWIEASRAGFLDAYRTTLGEAGMSHLDEPALLRPLSVAQECHEFVYAARFLPRWRTVPDLAIRSMFPSSDGDA